MKSLPISNNEPLKEEDEIAPGSYLLCQRCGNCCRWPGEVKVTEAEIDQIANFLNLPLVEFLEHYTHLREDRRGLSLNENPDHSCIFLDGQNCQIQAVKPQQCRDFPNKWRFPGWRKLCEAIEVPADPRPKIN